MSKVIRIAAVVVCMGSTIAWAQQNPLFGTWKGNASKSKTFIGAPPLIVDAKYEASGPNGVKYTSDRVSPTGVKSHTEFTANFDGKTYPYVGSDIRDGIAIKKIDSYTYQLFYKTGEETNQIAFLMVSKDGKTLSTVLLGVDGPNKDQVYSRIAVADKQ
jgi:hypothetical protein